jgi:uncharacterized coiled-coil protein SlyX
MTSRESERLIRVEERQAEMTDAINKITANLEKGNQKLDELNSKFDNLTGGKQAIMWITGIVLTIAGLIAAYINVLKNH